MKFLAYKGMGVITVQPPEVACVFKLVFAIMNPEVNRLIGFAFYYNGIEPGTAFGSLGAKMDRRLAVVPGGELDIDPDSYIAYEDGKILLAEAAIPAMLTRDPRAVRLDCLGYLMHRVDRTGKRTETR